MYTFTTAGAALATASAYEAAVGAAAQTSGTTTLDQVTVSDQAEAIGGLQKTYSGGQLARGGDLGL
ncbi:hypothetical protein, partial [Bordetella petrii]|uniref:hypothetical protein n=1 Tax=Bordetella petrii TaxID=94624 RepID=UPI001E3C0F79